MSSSILIFEGPENHSIESILKHIKHHFSGMIFNETDRMANIATGYKRANVSWYLIHLYVGIVWEGG